MAVSMAQPSNCFRYIGSPWESRDTAVGKCFRHSKRLGRTPAGLFETRLLRSVDMELWAQNVQREFGSHEAEGVTCHGVLRLLH